MYVHNGTLKAKNYISNPAAIREYIFSGIRHSGKRSKIIYIQ
jgi:hypothetical protein